MQVSSGQGLASPVVKLRIMTLCVLTGFLLAIFFHAFMVYAHIPYPYTSFLFFSLDRFGDFFKVYDASRLLNPYFDSAASNYFPVTYILCYPFTFLPPVIALLTFSAIFIGFLLWLGYYFLRPILPAEQPLDCWQTIITLFLLSYPVLFCLDRGNIENLLFILVSLFVVAFINKKYFLASILLALAAGMKLYPLALIVLFIKKRRYPAALSTIIFLLIFTITSYSLLQGGLIVNVRQSLSGMHQYANSYYILDNGFNFYTSLFTYVKLYIYSSLANTGLLTLEMVKQSMNSVMPYYTLTTLLLYGLLALHILWKETQIWKQLLLIMGAIILLPPASADYKLIYLFIPLLLYINADYDGPFQKIYIILFMLLLIPKNYIIFSNGLSLVSIMNPVMLAGMILIIIYESYRYPAWHRDRMIAQMKPV